MRGREHGPHQPFVKQGETKPPPHYTENTLLAAMETAGKLVEEEELKVALKERGLGTPATRAAIIETLLTRDYIRRDKKNLVATDLGRYLIALVRDPRLKSAELTGDWEARLRRIEQGELDPRRFASFRKLIAEQAHNSRSLAERHERERKFGRYIKAILKDKGRIRGEVGGRSEGMTNFQ